MVISRLEAEAEAAQTHNEKAADAKIKSALSLTTSATLCVCAGGLERSVRWSCQRWRDRSERRRRS